MQTQSTITPRDLQALLSSGKTAHLLDVRSPAEYSGVHIPGTQLIPLDELDPVTFCKQRGADCSPVYVICQSGGRAARAIQKLEAAGVKECVLLDGGTQAWVDAGFPVNRGQSRVLPLMRQVQITIGAIAATGSLLALLVDPKFAVIPLFMGCGLLMAGITGFCGLALLIAKMPWNKTTSPQASSCCTVKTQGSQYEI
jgi:rhodanese-related sulfurtransferase